MNTKLLRLKYAVATCVLALTVGTANASTFNVSGSFLSSSVTTLACIACGPVPSPDVGASLSGTVTITNTVLTSVNLTTSPNGPAFVETLPGYFSLGFVWTPGTLGTSATLSNLSPDGLSWDLSLVRVNPGATGGGSLSFHDMNGMLTGAVATNCCGSLGTPVGSLQQWSQPGTPQIEAWVDNYFGLSGTVHVVPLPGALPLFAIGLGALGLLGWRRKRKAAA